MTNLSGNMGAERQEGVGEIHSSPHHNGDPLVNHALTLLLEENGQNNLEGQMNDELRFRLGESMYNLAKTYYDKADLKRAQIFFEKASSLCQLPKDNFTLFKIHGFLVRIASERMDGQGASLHINQSEKILQNMGEQLGSLNSEYFYNQGTVLKYKGNFFDSRDAFILALKKSKEENETNVLSKTLYSLANLSLHTQEYQQALNYLGQLYELLQVLKKTYLIGTMNLLHATIYSELDQYREAMDHFQRATSCFQKKNCWNQVGYVLLGQGTLSKKMGEFTKASWYLNQALLMVDTNVFKRLSSLLRAEVSDLNDSNVDIYLDRTNRMIYEKNLGAIDFKHRFVLLEILFLLAQNSGKYYDKEDLASLIWKDEYNPLIHDKLIYTSVSRLRKLIEPKGEKRKYIIRGKDGYTFNSQIRARFQREGRTYDSRSIGNVDLASPV